MNLSIITDISTRRLATVETDFVREIYHTIEWNSRLILIKGCRGVGKTYMMIQHLKLSRLKSAYISLDHIFFLTHTLTETIDALYATGVRLVAVDEIHKYPNWSIELKNIYDSFPDIHIVMTSSSALDIMSGKGDLSRRLDEYHMRGLSFREYIKLDTGLSLPGFTLEELLTIHHDIYETHYEAHDLGRKFNAYIKKGYYPYYKEAGNKYYDRLLAVINQVIESDMAAVYNINYEASRQLKKLLAIIAGIVPYSPNVTKLSRDLVLSRNSVLLYLDYLAEADILSNLKAANKSDSALTKPDKIYFENTNLLYSYDAHNAKTGTVRETFVMNVLKDCGKVSTPLVGDFLYNESYIIEVGGANKSFAQLSGVPNGILVKEGITRGSKGVVPMWMMGLLR